MNALLRGDDPTNPVVATVGSGSGSSWGTGGMATKLTAAGIASAAGIRTVIMQAVDMTAVPDIITGFGDPQLGTQVGIGHRLS